MTKKRTFTTGEIADYCGVTFRTVIRWVDKGELKGYELPGRGDKRIELNDFLAFLKKHNMPIPAEFAPNLKRVLIVEDDRLSAHAIQRALQRAGFDTLVATESFQAGTLVGTYLPTVMTLDLNMPGLNGHQILQAIATDAKLHYLKVLVVSGATQNELDKALELGAHEVLEKPFANQVLVEKVSKLAGLSSLASAT